MVSLSTSAKTSNIWILEIVQQIIAFVIVNISNVVGKLFKTRNYIYRQNKR